MTGNGTTYRVDLAGTSWDSYVFNTGGQCEYSIPSTFAGAYTSGGRVTVANEYQTQGILGTTGGVNLVRNCQIKDNVLTGWGMLLSGDGYDVSGNTVRGYDYGSGIVLEADAVTYNNRVVDNEFAEGFGIDINLTQPSGIESWSQNTLISNNIVRDCANGGISFGGKYTVVTGNVSYNNGTYNSTGAGIVNAWQDNVVYNGSYSVVQNNITYDTGSGYQQYGYLEYVGRAFTDVAVLDNQIYGVTTPYSFSAASVRGRWRGYTVSGSTSGNYRTLTGSVSIAVGESVLATYVTVNGCDVGDLVEVSVVPDQASWRVEGFVSATNVVALNIRNSTSASSQAPNTTVTTYITVRQRRP
jgi:hypothetical protein